MELQSEGARRRLQGSQKALSNTRTGGIDQQSNDGRCGYQFAQQLQPLRPHLYVQVRYAGQVAAGPVEAGDKPNLDRVDRYREDDRNGRSRRLCRKCRRSTAGRRNHSHLTVNQVGRQCRQSIILAVRPAIFDRHVLALDISCILQSLAERVQTDRISVRRCAAKKPDHRHSALLSTRGEWPRHRRATEKRDELASLHGRRPKQATTPYHVSELSDVFCITAKLAADVRDGSENETARAVGRCGMAVPTIDGTMRASYLMMMRGQKQIVQHDDLAISSTALGAHRT